MQKIISLLTEKQERFYKSLQSYINEKGEAPTIAELMKLMKLSSPRAVSQYLETLERKGLITRTRYGERGIRLAEPSLSGHTITIPVIASAGCDNLSVFAERAFNDFICVASELLKGKKRENVVSIKAMGDSMLDAGVRDGDYVLVELTEGVQEGDLVVAVIDGFAVLKKLELANNVAILRPVSSDPKFKPIILHRDFKVFGRVIDIIRMPQKGELEIVPIYT